MPAILPASSKVGALLRKMYQEKSEAPHVQPPAAEPAAPAREMVEAPLETPLAPESPQTARVISIRPESTMRSSSTDTPPTITPTTAKVGPIGGVPGGMAGRGGTVDEATGITGRQYAMMTPEQQATLGPKFQPPDRLGEPSTTPQPTLDEYLAQGKTAAQWYAETGKQGILDQINTQAASRGIDVENLLKSGKITGKIGPYYSIDPVTGGVKYSPPPPGPPNTATVDEYLAQGKTVEQWFAETGRQNELDKLTQGATVAPPANLIEIAREYTKPAVQPAGEVLGFSTPSVKPGEIPTRYLQVSAPTTTPTSEFIGPVGPPPGWESMTTAQKSAYISPIQMTPEYSLEPTPTPLPGFQAEFERILREQGKDAADKFVKDYLRGQGIPEHLIVQ